jgi:hypothetical protein
MAKRVFFCFHYDDVVSFRANVVRNHWVTKGDIEEAGFFDNSLWEETQTRGSAAVKRLINDGLENTSATCVLVGSQTYARPWVRYEILKSMMRGNRLLALHINEIPDKYQQTKGLGPNPFDYLGVQYSADGQQLTLYETANGRWEPYTEVDGSASYRLKTPTSSERRAKFFRLSERYPAYAWNRDKGFENFSSWVA